MRRNDIEEGGKHEGGGRAHFSKYKNDEGEERAGVLLQLGAGLQSTS